MSIIQSIAKCKKPIGHGADREIFYSIRHNVVIKRNRPVAHSFLDYNEQMQNELAIIDKMRETDKELFPVLDTKIYKGEIHLIMAPCIPITEVPNWQILLGHSRDVRKMWELTYISEQLKLDKSYNRKLAGFIKRFHLKDLHFGNLGIYHNHLVILDAGY